MRRLLLILALLLSACAASQQEAQGPMAAVVAVSANEVFPVLRDTYVAAGEKAVAEATNVEDAHARVQAVKAKWRPIWEAWDAFAESHDLWRQALLDGDSPRILEMAKEAREAYCALAAAAPIELPAMPGIVCALGQNGGAQ